jgi:hypothetical protein
VFLSNGPLSAFGTAMFLLTCFYWAISAQQFRVGFPALIIPSLVEPAWWVGTFYHIYRAIPFVFELRTLLDWSCNPTVLFFNEWLKLEDIWAKMCAPFSSLSPFSSFSPFSSLSGTSCNATLAGRKRPHKSRGFRSPRGVNGRVGGCCFCCLRSSSGDPSFSSLVVRREFFN